MKSPKSIKNKTLVLIPIIKKHAIQSSKIEVDKQFSLTMGLPSL